VLTMTVYLPHFARRHNARAATSATDLERLAGPARCPDELGYMELDRRGAELHFQVLTEREARSAIAIASNEPFSGWTRTFGDPRLCRHRRPAHLRRTDH